MEGLGHSSCGARTSKAAQAICTSVKQGRVAAKREMDERAPSGARCCSTLGRTAEPSE